MAEEGYLLTDQEKKRFSFCLNNEVTSNAGLLAEMEKFGVPPAVLEKFKIDSAACRLVESMINSVESMTVSSAERGPIE